MFYSTTVAFMTLASLCSAGYHPFHQRERQENMSYADDWEHQLFSSRMQESSSSSIRAVESMDLNSYMGRWYQVMENGYSRKRMGSMLKCVTFDFFRGPQTKVETIMSANFMFDSQMTEQFDFEMDIPNPVMPSKWRQGSSNFWVLKLGPKREEEYEYAVVGDPMGHSLVVIARDVQRFNAMYKEEVMTVLQRLGFTGGSSTSSSLLKRPMESMQSSCNYAATPPPVVKDYNLEEMTGRWYEFYHNIEAELELPMGAKCNFADVKKMGKDKLQITSSVQMGESKVQTMRHLYQIPDMQRPGEVLMQPLAMLPHEEPQMQYASQGLMIKLGPEVDGQYQYAIFSDALRSRLSIIVREVQVFDRKYKGEVLRFLDNSHFMDQAMTQPIRVNHKNCIYEKKKY